MRVLIIGHNVFSETNNMGKTLLSYFQDFSPDELAEFYIQQKTPKNATVCARYYRVTDREALKSVLGKKVGTSYHLTESVPEVTDAETTGTQEAIRQYGRNKSPLVFALRNGIWGLSHWDTKELRAWLTDFDPELIFFMSGDFAFMYDITLKIQKLLNKPLVVCCVDDYCIYNRNEGSALGRALHRGYLRSVRRVMEKAACILTISDSLSEAYEKLFDRPCRTLHTNAKRREINNSAVRDKVAYFGNLDFHRNETLTEIGQTVKKLGLPGLDGIEVWSAETDPNNLAGLTEENGVRFRGRIPPTEVGPRMDECLAVIHTEAFREETVKMVEYSVSTKIADSLLNGPCLIAYGPEGIASIDYLKKNRAAYVITRPEDLEAGLRELLTDGALRDEILKNARALAARNHDAAVCPKQLRAWLRDLADRAGSGT